MSIDALILSNCLSDSQTALQMNGIGLATLRFETDIVAADYAAAQSLGGLLLIDPHSNDTVALGVVEPDAEVDDLVPASANHLATAFVRLGLAPRDATADEVTRRAIEIGAGALLTGAIALVLTGSAGLALAGALADIVLRPALGLALGRARLWVAARRKARDETDLTIDGGGI